MNAKSLLLLTFTVFLLSGPVAAKEWSDASGRHSFQGELIAASETTAVVRNTRGRLQAYNVSELSKADQEYVREFMKTNPKESNDVRDMHTWTGREGTKFKGRVTGFGTKALNVTYERGDIRVNKTTLRKLDPIYQMMLPKIVGEFDDASVKDISTLRVWGRKLRGKSVDFSVDGVMMQLENRDQIAVPLFLFSDEERKWLEQGWDAWSSEASKEQDKQRESFLAQQQAAEYQRNQAAEKQQQQQIQMMQLGLMAVNAGVTDVWQVQLIPRPGVRGRPTAVVVPARNSREASAAAMQKYPGFVAGAARQLNRP